jgi:hypothetical protein
MSGFDVFCLTITSKEILFIEMPFSIQIQEDAKLPLSIYLSYVRQRSRYSGWLRAGRPEDRSSSPGRVKNFLFSIASRPTLGSTQLPTQWIRELFHKEESGWSVKLTPPTSAEVKKVWIYTCTPPYASMA